MVIFHYQFLLGRGHVHIHVATYNVESTLLLLPTHPSQITSTVAAPYLMNTSPPPLVCLVLIYFRMDKISLYTGVSTTIKCKM